MTNNANALTEEAKSAIRSYMLHLIALPAIVASVIMFVLGFLVNEVASGRAYNEAYKEASSKVLGLTEKAALAAHDATRVKGDIQEIKKELETIIDEARTIREKLKTAEAFQKSENIVKEVSSSLAGRSDFKTSILNITENRITEIEKLVNSAHSRIDGIRLSVVKTTESPQFACGGAQKADPDNLVVMYGSRDGTGCEVHNLNYYKELNLAVPSK